MATCAARARAARRLVARRPEPFGAGLVLDPAPVGVEHHLAPVRQVQHVPPRGGDHGNARRGGQNRRMGGGAPECGAEARRARADQRAYLARQQFLRDDDRAGRRLGERLLGSRNRGHHLPLQVDEVGRPLGEQRVGGRAQPLRLRARGGTPRIGGAPALADEPVGGLDQLRVVEQGAVRVGDPVRGERVAHARSGLVESRSLHLRPGARLGDLHVAEAKVENGPDRQARRRAHASGRGRGGSCHRRGCGCGCFALMLAHAAVDQHGNRLRGGASVRALRRDRDLFAPADRGDQKGGDAAGVGARAVLLDRDIGRKGLQGGGDPRGGTGVEAVD